MNRKLRIGERQPRGKSAIPEDWRESLRALPRRLRRRENGRLVQIKNTASARNAKGRSIVIRHGAGSDALRLGTFDLRSTMGREYRARMQGLVEHLGGADAISAPQRTLVDRAARLGLIVETSWAELSKSGAFRDGEPTAALHAFLRLIGEERSVLLTLGLARREKTVRSLSEVLSSEDESE